MIKDGKIWVIWSESADRNVVVVDKYDHSKVFSYRWKGGKNQQWYTRKLGSDKWAIQNVETGDYLAPASATNLSRVTVSGTPTPWYFNASNFGTDTTRELSLANSSPLVLTLQGGSDDDKAPIVVQNRNNKEYQAWRIVDIDYFDDL